MKSLKFLSAAVLLTISGLAAAGYTQPSEVRVDLEERFADGDMMTARWVKDKDTYIGCGVRHIDNGEEVFKFGFCQASDEDKNAFTCTTFNPELLTAINTISDSSYVTFNWDEQGACTRIGVSTQSYYLDKDKKRK